MELSKLLAELEGLIRHLQDAILALETDESLPFRWLLPRLDDLLALTTRAQDEIDIDRVLAAVDELNDKAAENVRVLGEPPRTAIQGIEVPGYAGQSIMERLISLSLVAQACYRRAQELRVEARPNRAGSGPEIQARLYALTRRLRTMSGPDDNRSIRLQELSDFVSHYKVSGERLAELEAWSDIRKLTSAKGRHRVLQSSQNTAEDNRAAEDIIDQIRSLAAEELALGTLLPNENRAQTARQLNEMLPSQQERAPYAFEDTNGQLASRPFTTEIAPDRAARAVDELAYLTDEAKDLLTDLERSNSPRLLRVLIRLEQKLDSGASAIQLGLANSTFRNAAAASADELDDVIASRLTTLADLLERYLNNFPDWRQYAQDAADAAVSEPLARQMANLAHRLADQASALTAVAHQSVPQALLEVSEIDPVPPPAQKYGLLISLQNFGTGAARYVAERLQTVVNDVQENGIKALAIMALDALSVVALAHGHIWLEPILKALRRLLDK